MQDFKHNIVALIVEDEPQIRNILKEIVEDFVLTVHTANDGLEAQKILEDNKVHLLITDIHMPKMDGLALLDWVEEFKLKMTSIVITAYGDRDTVKNLLKKNIYDFIEKPFEPEMLENTINRAVNKINCERATEEILELLLYEQSDITPAMFKKMSPCEQQQSLNAILGFIKVKLLKEKNKN